MPDAGARTRVLFLAECNEHEPRTLKSHWGASKWNWIASAVAVFAFVSAMNWINRAAAHAGFAVTASALPTLESRRIVVLFLAGLVVTTLREFGHVLVAWAVGFRIRLIAIGPLMIWNDRQGRATVHLDWSRLLVSGGYMGAIPKSRRGVRINQMLVALGGPLLSLVLCTALLALVFGVPNAWRLAAIFAAMFLADFAGNLTPVGNTDGSIFFHLLLRTRIGREHVSRLLRSTDPEDAELTRAIQTPRRQAAEA
jgi:hypothetical protein